MPTTYKITVEEITLLPPINKGEPPIKHYSHTFTQEIADMDLYTIITALNPKPKRSRRTKAELAKERAT